GAPYLVMRQVSLPLFRLGGSQAQLQSVDHSERHSILNREQPLVVANNHWLTPEDTITSHIDQFQVDVEIIVLPRHLSGKYGVVLLLARDLARYDLAHSSV